MRNTKQEVTKNMKIISENIQDTPEMLLTPRTLRYQTFSAKDSWKILDHRHLGFLLQIFWMDYQRLFIISSIHWRQETLVNEWGNITYINIINFVMKYKFRKPQLYLFSISLVMIFQAIISHEAWSTHITLLNTSHFLLRFSLSVGIM